MSDWMRPLGHTGLEVSALGLGTVKLGRDRDVKYPLAYSIPDAASARRLLDSAREEGINFIDTAPAYGDSESRLGELLAGQRDDWVICTKVGEEWQYGSESGHSSWDFSPQAIRASVERSLRRLRCECLDLVLLHSDGRDRQILEREGSLQTLSELKQAGLLRCTGFSGKTVAGGVLAAQHCDVVMVSCNLQEQDQLAVLDECVKLGRGVLVKKPLASGHAVTVSELEAGLRLSLDHPGTGCAVIGTINPRHLRHNVGLARRILTAAP